MPTIEHQLTEIYVFVDDCLKAHSELADWRRSPHAHPVFTDADVITLAVMQGWLGCESLKKTYDLIADNFRSAFPSLPSYKQWIARRHALRARRPSRVRVLRAGLRSALHPRRRARAGRQANPQRAGAVASRRRCLLRHIQHRWFFGVKLHVIIDMDGCSLTALFLPANAQDRHTAEARAEIVDGGIGLAEHGYVGADVKDELAEQTAVLMVTPKDAGARRSLISTIGEKVETAFSQLWARFVDRIHSRSCRGLWNTITLKLLHDGLVTAGLPTA